jgi:hypothetical protein
MFCSDRAIITFASRPICGHVLPADSTPGWNGWLVVTSDVPLLCISVNRYYNDNVGIKLVCIAVSWSTGALTREITALNVHTAYLHTLFCGMIIVH